MDPDTELDLTADWFAAACAVLFANEASDDEELSVEPDDYPIS